MTTLPELESIISEGFIAYMRAGQAFLEIKERKLWKPDYPSFGAYVVRRWGIAPAHARRLRVAYSIIAPIVPTGIEIPQSERIVRELVGLPEDLTALTLITARATLPDGAHLTYSHVARTRAFIEELPRTGAVDIDGQSYAVADLLTVARPELLQAAYEAQARQRQHIADARKFDTSKTFEYLTSKAQPEELYALVKLLVRWLKENRKGVGV